MKKLLFTGGGGAGNEAVYRLWKDKYELHFADADLEAINPQIPSDRRHTIPFANDKAFATGVSELCNDYAIDLLIPAVDEELVLMPDIKKINPDLNIMVPNAEFVEVMLDKYNSMKAIKEKKLDMPATVTAENFSEISFPCIMKPRKGRGSRGFEILKQEKEVSDYLRRHQLNPNEAVIQEKIEGQEYTVMVAADRSGRLHAVVPVKVNIKKGITIRAETDENSRVTEACSLIHNAFNPPCCYNIQLFLTKDNQVFPFEINPRISTTFCLGVAAGVDPVEIAVENQPPGNSLKTFKNKMRLKRYWYNNFESL